jgi:TRAP-type uncharacterized transport system fused permease subunit
MKFLDWFPDIEVKGRKLDGYYKVIFGLIAASFSGFYLYTSGFGLVSSESNRAFYLLFTAILIFLSYPFGKKSSSVRPSVFDFIFFSNNFYFILAEPVRFLCNRSSKLSK